MNEADLKGANLIRAHLENALFDIARFFDGTLVGAHFEEVNLSNAYFDSLMLDQETHFKGANLYEVDFIKKNGLVKDQLSTAFFEKINQSIYLKK